MRLSLMLDAIHNIETYMKGIEDYDDFARNKIIVHAVEIDWGSIESFRHIIVHDYYQLEMPLIWSVLVNDLIPVKEFLIEQGVTTMGLL